MKTSTSFAVLALLATAGTSIAAPLPHHSNHKNIEESHDRHHHNRAQPSSVHPMVVATVQIDMNVPNGKHGNTKTQHARAKADPLSVTKPLFGAIGLPTADNLGTGGRNGHKMGKTKGQPTVNANKIISPTSDSVHSALKPLNSDGTRVGQQLNRPNSGEIGHLGKTADDALEPQETQISKNVLPRDVASSAVGGNSATKPVQTAATGISKNVATVNNNGNNNNLPIVGSDVKSVTAGNKVLPSATGGFVGQEVKSVTSGTVALPSVTSALLGSKGGILDVNNGPLGTDNGLVGTAGKLVTGTTGSLLNSNGQNLNTQTVTGTVGKIPNTAGNVVNGANVDPIYNQAVQLNTDNTESDVKKTTNTNTNKANDRGPKQTNQKLNALAFQGNGTDHRADAHRGDGSRDRTTQLISDNTVNNTTNGNNINTKQVNQTGQNVVGVNTDQPSTKNVVKTANTNTSSNDVQKQSDQTINSTNKPIDTVSDSVIPSNTQKQNGSLITANSDNVNAKLVQTPGKSEKLTETNSNDLTGSKSKGDNVNIKVALPQQAGSNNNNNNPAVNGVIGNNGLMNDQNGNGKIGPSDKNENVVNQVGNDKLLQQDIIATSSVKSQNKSNTPQTRSAQRSASHTSSSHSSSATEVLHNSTVKPQVFVEYTSFASTPSSTIASQSASVTQSTSATPLAEANVHSGTIQVNKNQHSTSSVKLALPSSVRLPLPSASSKALNSGKTATKPRQAKVTYGEKGEHVVACDGKSHQPNDLIDECIKADLLDYKPNRTEACPTDMQHDIRYGISTDMLNETNNQQAKEIQKYVRLCLTANSF